MGYPSFTLEDFHDTVSLQYSCVYSVLSFLFQFIDVVDSVSKPETSVASLVEVHCITNLSNHVTI